MDNPKLNSSIEEHWSSFEESWTTQWLEEFPAREFLLYSQYEKIDPRLGSLFVALMYLTKINNDNKMIPWNIYEFFEKRFNEAQTLHLAQSDKNNVKYSLFDEFENNMSKIRQTIRAKNCN